MKFKILYILLATALISCSKVPTISLKEHQFNNTPEKIIFVQIPFVSEEDIAMLKIASMDAKRKISTEYYTCMGKMWRFNHDNLRPSIESSLSSQLNGFPRSSDKCEMYKENNLWDALKTSGVDSSIYNIGSDEFINNAFKCNKDIFKNTKVFISKNTSGKTEKKFHYQKEESYENGELYFDESCIKGDCFSTYRENFDYIWNSMKFSSRKLLVVKNMSFKDKTKNIEKAIVELNNFLTYLATDFASRNNNSLIIVSFLKENGQSTQLVVKGALAENFCGQYSEFEMFNRFFWQSNKIKVPIYDDFKDLF